MDDPIRILVADDHTVVREGLCALLTARPDMEVVAEAADGVEAVEQVRALRPDVILMDLVMPRKGGLEAIEEIRAEDPEACILVLTSFAEDKKVFSAVRAGAQGYLLKDSSSKDLIQAIYAVRRGELSLQPKLALKALRELSQPGDVSLAQTLTERELEVLTLVAQGLSNQEIARELYISDRTVTTHVSNILSKLHLPNRTQAAIFAIKEGLIDEER